jgi:hypothetical protein
MRSPEVFFLRFAQKLLFLLVYGYHYWHRPPAFPEQFLCGHILFALSIFHLIPGKGRPFRIYAGLASDFML